MRFITEDTNKGDVKDPLSLNLYTYCVGNPIMYLDEEGHSPKIVIHRLNMSFDEFMSNIISYIPFFGDAKDFYEALTGIDSITGKEISKSGRLITLACAAVPFVPGKGGREMLETARKASNYIPQNEKWVSSGKTMVEWLTENKYRTKIGSGTDIGKIFVFDKKGNLIGEIHSGQIIDKG